MTDPAADAVPLLAVPLPYSPPRPRRVDPIHPDAVEVIDVAVERFTLRARISRRTNDQARDEARLIEVDALWERLTRGAAA